ncbi:MAG: hypothetical protein NC453_30500 [Muribaculum sp.]|nr:hypothetical protein [Muribaculum sp.]
MKHTNKTHTTVAEIIRDSNLYDPNLTVDELEQEQKRVLDAIRNLSSNSSKSEGIFIAEILKDII